MKKRLFLYLLSFTFLICQWWPSSAAREQALPGKHIYTNQTHKNTIRTVYFERPDWRLTYPMFRLNSGNQLTLHFDEMGSEIHTYYYRFIHCNSNWESSGLSPSDFMEGFEENPVENYTLSFNTTRNYVHYQLSFPNAEVKFTISGNYILEIFPLGAPGEPVLTRRFMINENMVGIAVNAHRSQIAGTIDSHQQVDVEVSLGQIDIDDPYNQVRVWMLQNGRWDNAKRNLKPDFMNGKTLLYNDLSGNNIFFGGVEFRQFDIKSIRYVTEFVDRIDFRPPYYHAILQPGSSRAGESYFYRPDLNGKYFIEVQEGVKPTTDADYLYVYFTLPVETPLPQGTVHVHGALTDWKLNGNSRMQYNPETGAYENRLLLKQGIHNYYYVFVPDESPGHADITVFEGSHDDTENDYIILVYYKDPLSRYERLIGSRVVNSLNK